MRNPLLKLVDLIAQMLDRIKRLEVMVSPKIQQIPASANWYGVPKPGLTWDEVSEKTQEISPIIPMTIPQIPTCCPSCGKKLLDYKSDWEKIEDSGQYMVVGVYCPDGHWTHLDWA